MSFMETRETYIGTHLGDGRFIGWLAKFAYMILGSNLSVTVFVPALGYRDAYIGKPNSTVEVHILGALKKAGLSVVRKDLTTYAPSELEAEADGFYLGNIKPQSAGDI